MKTKAIIFEMRKILCFCMWWKRQAEVDEKKDSTYFLSIFSCLLLNSEFSRKAIISGNNLFGKDLQRLGKWIMILTSSCEWSDCRSYCKYSQERHSVILLTYFLEIFLIPPGKVSQCFRQVINWIVAWPFLQILVIGNNLRRGIHQDIPYI